MPGQQKTHLPGPQPLTIQQYRLRQQLATEQKLTAIPPTGKPKHRRGGKIVRLRRRLAFLKSIINADPPPPWYLSDKMWLEVEKELHPGKQ